MTGRIIRRRAAAMRDLARLTAWLFEQDRRVAPRFVNAVEKALSELADMPEMGSLCEFEMPDLVDLRYWTLRKFPNHVIFYRPIESGIEVVRVFHAAQDLEAFFRE